MYLVGYDIHGVHRYVFEPVRPMDIMGGSLLLEHFGASAGELAQSRGAEVVTSAGGRGIFRVPDERSAQTLAQEIGRLLDRLTAGGAQCTVAWVRDGGHFPSVHRALVSELRRRRFEEEVGQPARQFVPRGTRPEAVCQACGREPGCIEDRVSEERERIGPRCQARRRQARSREGAGKLPTIGEVVGGTRDEVPRGAVLAAVYLDGDGLGRQTAEISNPAELRHLSLHLNVVLRQALKEVQRRLEGCPLVRVAAGGDDLLVFCDARRLLDLLGALWDATESLTDEHGVTFSTGIVVGEPLLPLRLYFREAEEALKEAKICGRGAGTPHVGVRGLMAGTRYGMRGDLFGGPLPRDAFRTSGGGIRALVEVLAELVPSQCAGLADDLSLESGEEAMLAVEYRASRSDGEAPAGRDGVFRGMARALQLAREIKEQYGSQRPPGAGPLELDLLRGALVFASFEG